MARTGASRLTSHTFASYSRKQTRHHVATPNSLHKPLQSCAALLPTKSPCSVNALPAIYHPPLPPKASFLNFAGNREARTACPGKQYFVLRIEYLTTVQLLQERPTSIRVSSAVTCLMTTSHRFPIVNPVPATRSRLRSSPAWLASIFPRSSPAPQQPCRRCPLGTRPCRVQRSGTL